MRRSTASVVEVPVSRPDDGLIHAWLDGELDAAEAARVARLVETDAEWGAAAAEARGLIAASSRIVKSLDVVPGGVIPSGSKAGGAPVKRTIVRPWLRIAATIALVAGVGYVATDRGDVAQLEVEQAVPAATANAGEFDRQAAPAATQPAAPVVTPTVDESRRDQRRRAAREALTLADSRAAGRDTLIAQDAIVEAKEAPVPSLRSAVTAAAPTAGGIAPPSTAAPPLGNVAGLAAGERAERAGAGAPLEQAKTAARAPAPTAALLPRQIIDREQPSALAASDAVADRVLTGCWRTRTTAPSDSVLVDPRILSVAGDSLVIVLNRASLDLRTLNREVLPRATVVRVGVSALSGTARNADGAVVPFAATRTTCP
jgi:hypothetical protein